MQFKAHSRIIKVIDKEKHTHLKRKVSTDVVNDKLLTVIHFDEAAV